MKTLCLLFAVLTATVAVADDRAFPALAIVNTPGDGFLSLRSEPSTRQGRRLLKIPHGTVVTLKHCAAEAGQFSWCLTTYDGKQGWIYDRYLSYDNTTSLKEILGAVSQECTPDICEPSVERVLGDYASVIMKCKRTDCDNAVAFLKHAQDGWVLVEYGSGVTPEDLIDDGFPADVAHQLAW